MKKNKKIILSVCLITLLICAVAVGSWGAVKLVKSNGGYVSKIVNRVNITVDKTKFDFTADASDKTVGAVINFAIEKTEPDFYCKLGSVTLEGVDFENLIYAAGEENVDSSLPENIALGANDNGTPRKYSWDISFVIGRENFINAKNINLRICYESGITKANAQRYETILPIEVEIK